MVRKCAICATSKENSENKFHSFPKDPIRKQAWLNALGIRFHLKSNTICSDHFLPENYYSSGLLKRDAVPGKTPNRTIDQTDNTIIEYVTVECDPNSDFDRNQIDLAAQTTPLNIYSLSSPGHSSVNSEEELITPIKRHKRFNANSIGDLTVNHFYPLRRAKQHLGMVKETFKRKAALIRNLQKQNKRLHDKLNKYEELIQSLRRKNFMLEKSAHKLQSENIQKVVCNLKRVPSKKSNQTAKLCDVTQEESQAPNVIVISC